MICNVCVNVRKKEAYEFLRNPGGREAGAEGAQLAVRHDQVRLVDFYAGLGYVLADDVELTTPNPRSPPPIGMRKDFRTTR